MERQVYREIANLLLAIEHCQKAGNKEWEDRHTARIEEIVREHMPRGSGFDSGTTLYLGASSSERLVFDTSYHHMDSHGSYDGWTDHRVTVRPSLVHGISLSISGRDRNDIKDFIHEAFKSRLEATVSVKPY